MKEVWIRLRGNEVIDPAFRNLEISDQLPFPRGFRDRSSWLQNIALIRVCETALNLGHIYASAAVDATFAAKFDDYRLTAEILRNDASLIRQTFSRRKGTPPTQASAAQAIELAADAYDRIAREGFAFSPQGHAPRMFSMSLTWLMADLFAKIDYNVIATISSVVLRLEVYEEQVKEWDRGFWGRAPRIRSSRPST